MFALSRGEVAIVAFIFVLVWSAVALPRLAADVAARWIQRTARRERARPSDQGR